MPRTGRRTGRPDTRASILSAARKAFADRGFDGASIRAIATAAGVDPALIHHYFGTKERLFTAAVGAPVDPREALSDVLAGGREGLAERLVRHFLKVWGDPVSGPAVAALVRSGMRHDWSLRLLREFLETQILRRVMAELGLDPREAAARASLVASQMAGLGMIRYVIKLEPLASAPVEAVVAAVAPTIQRYLTGTIGGFDHAGGDGGAQAG